MTMTHEANAHRISIVDPAEYKHVGEFYQGTDRDMMAAFAPEHRYLEALGIEFGDFGPVYDGAVEFHRNRGCAHCGAHFAYGAVFAHPCHGYVAVGHICAANIFAFDDKIVMRAARAKAAVVNKRARAAKAAKAAAEFAEILAGVPGLAEALETDHHIVADIGAKGAMYGNLSEKQIALVFKIAKDEAEKAAAPEVEEVAPGTVPVTDDRVEIEATFISSKYVENDFGGGMKMLVEVAGVDGPYRLFGTMPKGLGEAYDWDLDDGTYRPGVVKGDTVRFVARIERSRDDAGFGFTKRPTKAVIVAG